MQENRCWRNKNKFLAQSNSLRKVRGKSFEEAGAGGKSKQSYIYGGGGRYEDKIYKIKGIHLRNIERV